MIRPQLKTDAILFVLRAARLTAAESFISGSVDTDTPAIVERAQEQFMDEAEDYRRLELRLGPWIEGR